LTAVLLASAIDLKQKSWVLKETLRPSLTVGIRVNRGRERGEISMLIEGDVKEMVALKIII
jgi:hypothetical protein